MLLTQLPASMETLKNQRRAKAQARTVQELTAPVDVNISRAMPRDPCLCGETDWAGGRARCTTWDAAYTA